MQSDEKNPQINAKLASKAASKLTELRKTIDTLVKSKEKDRTYIEMQTRTFQAEVRQMKKIIHQQHDIISEKDKIIRLQALKLDQVFNADDKTRSNLLKEDVEIF